MNETKFTPAVEWKVKSDGNLLFVFADENAEAVCSVFPQRDGDGVFTDSKMANAKLIAAAPDMLHVLRNLQAYSERMRAASTPVFSPAYDFQINNVIKKATS